MSRGIKDLRELICVSRLTFRDSDDSDENDRLSSALEVSTPTSSTKSANLKEDDQSPEDSGFANGTSVSSPSPNEVSPSKTSQKTAENSYQKRKRNRKKKKKMNTFPSRHEWPKDSPLPPVNQASGASQRDRPSSSSSTDSVLKKIPGRGNFDAVIVYLDATLVANWLVEANTLLSTLSSWCNSGENFVLFSHFWLSDFHDEQRKEIFKLEYGILLDHLHVGFQSGIDSGFVSSDNLVLFMDAILREYPDKLLSSKVSYLFLEYLEILVSERQDSYRKLLSDVKCSTTIKQHAQLVLATRSFALASVWSAIINFYRSLFGVSVNEPTASVYDKKINETRMQQAIRNGFVDVIAYLLRAGKLSPLWKDEHNRSLVFTAVVHGQREVLDFLLGQVKPRPDVNAAADTGNSPLHAAANNGNAVIVQKLLKVPGINPNPTNPQCENATPLHLAVMHGHHAVVEVLLKSRVDREVKMGDMTAEDIARNFEHDEIIELFTKCIK